MTSSAIDVRPDDVLLVIDVQNDFCSGGKLAVPDGEAVVPLINRIAGSFEHVILTQDWHPAGHLSFASTHPGKAPFESGDVSYGKQTLWPDHCVQKTSGAELVSSLHIPKAELILRKGFRKEIDSYSAFFENDRKTSTGLAGYLSERQFRRVFLAGLAYDFCVGFSAIDARRLGFEAIVIKDASRAIDTGDSLETIEKEFQDTGVVTISSNVLTN
ncbi:bifunctional nicotinamidase/pyrazinamidase [Silvibacterium acidisoli]|uniref:bifunctional nicotinamidase/pyrazinamidase n=1 Tax=Acidobacteriaceae bacterium ZG23-2 TaxID=2883246 RepID=UPI00406D26C7